MFYQVLNNFLLMKISVYAHSIVTFFYRLNFIINESRVITYEPIRTDQQSTGYLPESTKSKQSVASIRSSVQGGGKKHAIFAELHDR